MNKAVVNPFKAGDYIGGLDKASPGYTRPLDMG